MLQKFDFVSLVLYPHCAFGSTIFSNHPPEIAWLQLPPGLEEVAGAPGGLCRSTFGGLVRDKSMKNVGKVSRVLTIFDNFWI